MHAAGPEPRRNKPGAIRRDWISKTLAGLVLGLSLAMTASALYSALHADLRLPVRGQLMMWMVPPIGLGTLSTVYFFASGLRAWLWLGLANALAYGALLVLRQGL
ncbi:hypothetical protein QOZ44_23820 [Pseudomonas aeruginosa]|uniref:hypothetical protein n=2 Tax=Pseudomonas aeruginosa TaxID=287 RepID=UPI00053E9BA2|nr:hypothetical protein [Pseudomonas aeruginosa]MCO2533377.1 hypothetical protein [Pseudomonas aeruginosa]MCS8265629.1 hypothetical protein [Pseudomonas aeruginosa]RCA28649.1 hypothetical protein C6A84_20935 [Pseudomonas aeruginosa]HBO1244607.1 hypothetical protein [Pseudomonas aeruginosa]HBO1330465.1 hypothetical protein [Pseudomonas aeruginosa]